MKGEYWFTCVAFGLGVLVWILVSTFSNQKEAWDSGLYLSLGIPTLCLSAALMGYYEPKGAWRWGTFPLLGQAIWMFATQGFGNLWPLGLAAFALLAIPSLATSRIGAAIRRRSANT